MTIKGIIFDLDGTLVDTLQDLTDSMNIALAALGCPPRSARECRRMIGNGLKKFAERAINQPNPALRDKLLEVMTAHYRTNCLNKTRPYTGLTEAIKTLRHQGLRLAVLTNKNQHPAEIITRHYFGSDTFDPIIGCAPSRPPKPDPAGALEILAMWNIPPGDVLLIGDSEADAETAANANITFLGCEWGFRTREQLMAAGASALIDSPQKIVEYLKGGSK